MLTMHSAAFRKQRPPVLPCSCAMAAPAGQMLPTASVALEALLPLKSRRDRSTAGTAHCSHSSPGRCPRSKCRGRGCSGYQRCSRRSAILPPESARQLHRRPLTCDTELALQEGPAEAEMDSRGPSKAASAAQPSQEAAQLDAGSCPAASGSIGAVEQPPAASQSQHNASLAVQPAAPPRAVEPRMGQR